MARLSAAVHSMLFPDEPRDFQGRRLLRSALRAVHILGGGMLIAAFYYQQPPGEVGTWVAVAAASGLLLLFTDLYASCAVLFEWRGLAVFLKIGLLLAIPWFPGSETLLLTIVLVVGSISSHLSRRFRHRLWLNYPGVTVDTRRG